MAADPSTSTTTLTYPDYGGFDLRDTDAEEGDRTLLDRARVHVVAAGAYEMCVQTSQQHSRVAVTVQRWQHEPSPPVPAWDPHGEHTLMLPTGELLIWQRTYGPAGAVDLGEKGTYRVRVWSRQREEAARRVAHLTSNDVDDPFNADALSGVDGVEKYLFQFWRPTS